MTDLSSVNSCIFMNLVPCLVAHNPLTNEINLFLIESLEEDYEDDFEEELELDLDLIEEFHKLMDYSPELEVKFDRFEIPESSVAESEVYEELLPLILNPKFNVFLNLWPLHEKSIFSDYEELKSDTIYDSVQPKNKTRFTTLPLKYSKKNQPVTFHKQVKSSGYGTAPDSRKYMKKKKP